MKKYLLPIINFVVSCGLLLVYSFRSGTVLETIPSIAVVIILTVFQIVQIHNNGNEIKIRTMNIVVSIFTVVLIFGGLYTLMTGNEISENVGDILAIVTTIASLAIWIYEYYIKPFCHQKKVIESNPSKNFEKFEKKA